jgi:hypothetical protein
MQPWDFPVPHVLYKYLSPVRLDVLICGHVRFSQRSFCDDDHELQPDYGSYGTEEEIIRFLDHRVSPENRQMLPDGIVRFVANSTTWQKMLTNIARLNMKSPDQFGIFCLTESLDSEQMRNKYADNSRGYVLSFDTTHPEFERLRVPGRLGKVSYSDKPLGTFLGAMEGEGAGIFCRKRMKYSFEREWRSIRALELLEYHPLELFFSEFSPASVNEIIIRPACSVAVELRKLVLEDPRYSHVQIRTQGE